MIIDANINSPLYIPDENLLWYVDFDKPIIEKGKGYFEYEANFWNELNGLISNKNHRILRVPLVISDENQRFSFNDLQQLFYTYFPMLNQSNLRTEK